MSSDVRALIRRRMRSLCADMTPAERMRAGAAIARILEDSGIVRENTAVAGFWSLPTEVPMLIVQMLIERLGARYHLPILGPEQQLRFGSFRAGQNVRANRFGIPEPAEPEHFLSPSDLDVVLMPLTAFDRSGNRLGSGGGWYDRSFAFRSDGTRSSPTLVGIAFADQETASVPHESWDVRMDMVITDRELIRCTASATEPSR